MKRALLTLAVMAWCAIASAVDITEFGDPATTTDWGPAIQQAIDSFGDDDPKWPDVSGGRIHFPRGVYPVKTPFVIRCPGILISGEGSSGSYACYLDWQNTDPDAAMFTFVASREDSTRRSHGFHMRDLLLRGKKKGVAFRFGAHDRYTRDFQFDRVRVSHFQCVFESTRGTGKARSWGGLTVNNCTLVYNGQILSAVDGGQFNEWRFRDCLLHKNGRASEGWSARYAFDFSGGSNGLFDGCVLENQPRAIRVKNFLGLRVIGCRFEGNTDKTQTDPVVLVEDSGGVWFRDNFHRVLKAEEGPGVPPTILIRNCRRYYVSPMLGGVSIRQDWKSGR